MMSFETITSIFCNCLSTLYETDFRVSETWRFIIPWISVHTTFSHTIRYAGKCWSLGPGRILHFLQGAGGPISMTLKARKTKSEKKYQSVSYYHRRRRCLASAIALLRLLEHVGDESITHTHVLRKLRHLAFFNDFSKSFYAFEGADHLDFRVIILAKSISWHCKKQWTIVA